MLKVFKRHSPGQTFALLVAVSACLAGCATSQASSQQPIRPAQGNTKQGARANDHATLFIPSAGGKTSPRRVQQQQQTVTVAKPQVGNGELSTGRSIQDNSQPQQPTTAASSGEQTTGGLSAATNNPSSDQTTTDNGQTGASDAPSRSAGDAQTTEQESMANQQQQLSTGSAGTETSLAVREMLQQMLDSSNQATLKGASSGGLLNTGVGALSRQQAASGEQATSRPDQSSGTEAPASAPKSMLVDQDSRQPQEQLLSRSGSALSTPSSISMSLDGMIVNSRPRIGGQQTNRQQQQANGRKTKQSALQVPTPRIGEMPPAFMANTDAQSSGFAMPNKNKASRRVPFSGVHFSSPATKGLRTKPRASNQVGSSMSPMAQMNNFITAQQQDQQQQQQSSMDFSPAAMQMNQFFNQQQPSAGFRNNLVQQQAANDAQGGFDGDQQVRLDMNQLQQVNEPMNAAEIELMRNLLASNVAMNTRSANARPDDMVMSVMSSADGKDRRLVMIARDTLDTLQRFAAQNPQSQIAVQNRQQQSAGTKTRQQASRVQVNNKPMMSRPAETSVGTETPANNWMVTGQDMWTTDVNQQQQQQLRTAVPTTTATPELRSTTVQQLDLQQTSITTTSAPANFAASSEGLQPTTTSPSRQAAAATTTQSPGFTSQDSQSSSTAAATTPADSFREVAVSTSASASEQSQANNLASEQQTAGQSTLGNNNGGSGKQQVSRQQQQTKGGKSSASGSESSGGGSSSQQARQSSGGRAGSSASQASGSNNNANGSGINKAKKNNGSTKQTSSKQQQKQSAGRQSSNQQASNNGRSSGSGEKKHTNGNKKVAGLKTKTTTNGQQIPMTVNVTQLSSEQSPPITTVAPVQSSTFSASNFMQQLQQQNGASATTNTLNEPVQLSTGRGDLQPPAAVSTTTSSSVISSRRPTVQVLTTKTTQAPSDGRFGREREPSSRLEPSGANGGASSTIADEQVDKRLDEMERNGQLMPNMMALPGRGASASESSSSSGTGTSELDGLRAAIPGEPLLDYPIYSAPPKTSFDCLSQSCPGGYYADLESQCQVFHICQNDGRSDTFLCPNGTIFSQQHFVCVWWWQVDCQQSQQYYKLNDNIYCNSMTIPSTSSSPSSNSNLDNDANINSLTSSSTSAAPSTSQTGGSSSSPAQAEGQRVNAQGSSSGGNDGASTGNFASDSAEQSSSANAVDQSTTNDSSPDSDLSQQQQQQLELLSRRA